MAKSQTTGSPLQNLAHKVLASFSLAWVVHAVELLRALHQFRQGHQPGLYEILEYETKIELFDSQGRSARAYKHQRVKFLQNHVTAFTDYIWGDGQDVSYTCTPGLVVDRYREGDRWNVLISLRSSRKRGEIEDFYIERRIENGFCKDEEWFQVEIRNPTRKLRMEVVFPATRPCKRAQVTARSRQHTLSLGHEYFHALPDGRQLVRWETEKIHRLEIYTLKWWW